MPSIIDTLVVQLGLDTTGYDKGQEQTGKSLDKLRRDADTTAVAVEKSQARTGSALDETGRAAGGTADAVGKASNRTNTSLRSIDLQATSVAKSFSAAGKTMASPFVAIAAGVGAVGLALGAMREALSGAAGIAAPVVAAAHAAGMSGVDLKQYEAWGNIASNANFPAEAAQGTVSSLAQQQAQAQITGHPSQSMQAIAQLGVNPTEDPIQMFKDIANSPAFQAMPTAMKTSYLENQAGFDAGTTYIIEQGSKFIDQALAAQAKLGNPDDKQATALGDLYTEINSTKTAFSDLAFDLLSEYSPQIAQFAQALQTFAEGFTKSKLYKTITADLADPKTAGPLNEVNNAVKQAGAAVHHWIEKAFSDGSTDRLGVRNNNPLNLKFANQPGATADAQGFAVFPTAAQGISAAYRQLLLDQSRGANTLDKIIPKWTTTDRVPYENTVLNQLHKAGYKNITGSTPIDLRNPALAQAVMSGMSVAEGDGKLSFPKGGSTPTTTKSTPDALPASVRNVLEGIHRTVAAASRTSSMRSAAASTGSNTVHHHQAIAINVTAPSGDAHAIAHTVKTVLRSQGKKTLLNVGGSLG